MKSRWPMQINKLSDVVEKIDQIKVWAMFFFKSKKYKDTLIMYTL